MKICNSESINNANLLGLVYSHEFNAYILYYTWYWQSISALLCLRSFIREKGLNFLEKKKCLHIPKILRIKILLHKWSWILILVRYACFEMGRTLISMKRKIYRQQFWKIVNSYRIFNPNVLLVFLLLLPFSLRKTVYHDHRQEL